MLQWNAMGTDTVRRGGNRGVRMNWHLCLAEELLKKEVRRVLSLERMSWFWIWQAVGVYSHYSCLSKTYQLHH